VLYNARFGLPEVMELPTTALRLDYTRHALEQSKVDTICDLRGKLPCSISLKDWEVVEAELPERSAFPKKLVVRRPVDDGAHYICLVVVPDGASLSHWFVKTVWATRKNHQHKLTDERYRRPA
jgi:hypothetical protein